MNHSTLNYQDDSLTQLARGFFLGVVVASAIGIYVSYATSEDAGRYTQQVDCSDPASKIQAENRSRNGVAYHCG